MTTEYTWYRTESFPSKTYEIKSNGILIAVIDKQLNDSFTCKSRTLNYLLDNYKVYDIKNKSQLICDLLDTDWNLYTIKSNTFTYFYNKINKDISDKNGKSIIQLTSDKLIFSKSGKIKNNGDNNDIVLLTSCLIYLRHKESEKFN